MYCHGNVDRLAADEGGSGVKSLLAILYKIKKNHVVIMHKGTQMILGSKILKQFNSSQVSLNVPPWMSWIAQNMFVQFGHK